MIERVEVGHMQSFNLRDMNIKKRYAGSYRGMRFMIRPFGESKDSAAFEVFVFPEPFNFDRTAEDKKTREVFPYSEEGLDQIHLWLNRQYETRREEWDAALQKGLLED